MVTSEANAIVFMTAYLVCLSEDAKYLNMGVGWGKWSGNEYTLGKPVLA
jgi:hypothetical protein